MAKTAFEQSKTQNNNQRNPTPIKRKSFRGNAGSEVLWDTVPETLLAGIVRVTTTQGASPTFGYTRNGSSLTIAIYHKGDRQVDYLSGPDEVELYLRWLIEDYFDLGPSELEYYGLGAPVAV